jgi:hypothetical protein
MAQIECWRILIEVFPGCAPAKKQLRLWRRASSPGGGCSAAAGSSANQEILRRKIPPAVFIYKAPFSAKNI